MNDNTYSLTRPELVSVQTHLAGAVVISVHGDVDLANVESLRAHLTEAIEIGTQLIVVDLTDLQYIDSCGIHALLDAHHTCAKDGHSIALAGAPSIAQRLFKIVGLDQAIPMYATVETAVERCRRGAGAAGC